MPDIFISYASEDHPRTRALAEALASHGWSVWWDRKIPLGKSFDDVIEQALRDSKCVIVLWSAVSVVSDWVRNEASEGKRRGILVPVFLDEVDAPLAFRLLNGANLSDWQPGTTQSEFDKLIESVKALLEQPQGAMLSKTLQEARRRSSQFRGGHLTRFQWSHFAIGRVAALTIRVAVVVYFLKGRQPEQRPLLNAPVATQTPTKATSSPESQGSELERAINGLSETLGYTTASGPLLKGFHVTDLGIQITYVSREQSASTMGPLPTGAVVMEVESGRPAAKAGLEAGDVIIAIDSKKIETEDDLRQAIRKIGTGKTPFSLQRGNEIKTVTVYCPNCENTS
jgi:hypothetical protein